ncbi:hypothetical protein [Marivirga sp.]|uniref:hypothetical protein n=1 Tax=Marivirga sp. TaxID=2018662 RepID=UPI002D7E3C2D|nr:hypothetical protein [Marivirga sp.]HET8858613.1 hypothetical protein [Marivirga sp.]
MKIIELDKLEEIRGGDTLDGVCIGFTIGTAGLSIASAANFWNPVGWGAAVVLAAGSFGCAYRDYARS